MSPKNDPLSREREQSGQNAEGENEEDPWSVSREEAIFISPLKIFEKNCSL
jgi:hypothetical protein